MAGTANPETKGAKPAPTPGSDPTYNDRNVFLPVLEALRPGDLILTRNREGERAGDRKMSAGIARVTGGSFSHVMICSVPPTMVEAMPEGVGTISLQRCFAHSLRNVRVLRHPNARVADAAASLTLPHIGRAYSVTRAGVSPFPARSLGILQDRGIFCSALAALVFRRAGAEDIFTRPPDKTTPSTIERYTGLLDVTDLVFREALAPKNVETMSALDGQRRPGPSDRQTSLLLRYGVEIFPKADQLVASFPQADLERPASFFNVLQLIIDAFAAAERVSDRAGFVTAVENLDEQSAAMLDSGELAAIGDEMVKLDQEALQQELRKSFDPDPDIDVDGLRGLLTTTAAQLAARSASIDGFRGNAWPTGPSRAIASWVRIQSGSLQVLEHRAVAAKEILDRLNA